jgi:hypothetical protein
MVIHISGVQKEEANDMWPLARRASEKFGRLAGFQKRENTIPAVCFAQCSKFGGNWKRNSMKDGLNHYLL